MDRHNKIILGGIIVLALAIVGVCIYSVSKNKDNIQVSDSVKFKEEYESLNGSVSDNGNVYYEVSLSLDNPVKYKTDEEIVDVLNKESAVIYFGYASCGDCRYIIKPLMEALKAQNVDTLYYVNIEDIRDAYVVSGDNKVEKTKEGTEGYQKILKILKNYLNEYYVFDDSGNEYDTKTKRLAAPTVVAVKSGEVKALYEGVVEDFDGVLDKDSYEVLYNIYNNLISLTKDDGICTTSESC